MIKRKGDFIMRGKMLAVIGAQYGSEGKGAIVSHIANQYDVHVRVGSPNAGHTIYWRGEKHVMQTIPCGWINPTAQIVIGRGALLNMNKLMEEIKHIERYYPDFRKRLHIDPKAGVLDEKFHQIEGGVDGEMHRRIGSTGEGVGPARMARLSRDPQQFYHFGDVAMDYGLTDALCPNTPRFIACSQDRGDDVLLEGTQGSALSLLHSNWPYCTSIDTNAAALLSEIGIAPERLTEVLLVARSYPIRVAGNSGPMEHEITWEELSRRIGKDVSERTTVTKKIRRVAEWDDRLFQSALVLNGAKSRVALMFADYIDPNIFEKTDHVTQPVIDFMIKHDLISAVQYVGTGPHTVIDLTRTM